jgi:mono/diheme cytochrome c family protein
MSRPVIAVIALALILSACASANADIPLKEGRTVYGNVCSACHGNTGQGGVGPALAGVSETFPSCATHIEWITLGSVAWEQEHGETYGALNKPVAGGMPGHASNLTPEQIAAVAAWERSTYAKVSEETAIDDCGVKPVDG